jgi:elongation factor P
MILASQLRPGMAVRYEGQIYRVVAGDYHPGQGKMGGVTHVRLRNVATAAYWEHSFRAELKLETVPVEKQHLEYLYSDADQHYFMNPQSFEQIGIPAGVIGPQGRFLQAGTTLTVEFVEAQPVMALFPDIMEFSIAHTAAPAHGQQDNTWKAARLENGVEIMVPQFIKTGDMVRVDINNLKYVDRAKAASR